MCVAVLSLKADDGCVHSFENLNFVTYMDTISNISQRTGYLTTFFMLDFHGKQNMENYVF